MEKYAKVKMCEREEERVLYIFFIKDKKVFSAPIWSAA